MTRSNENEPGLKEVKLPRRDWILLPLLSVLTMCLLVGSTELIARRIFTFSESTPPFVPACMGPVDPVTGARAIPDSVCWDKKFESQWVEYRFNSCGHRAGVECGPKPTGTYRIVLTGSSVAMGHLMPREKTFAALLPADIFRQTGRKIDLYNEGMVSVNSHRLALRMDEVLAAKPDVILWTLVPLDVETVLPVLDTALLDPRWKSMSSLAKAWYRIKAGLNSKSALNAARDFGQRELVKIQETASATLLMHFLYENQMQYVKSSLAAEGNAGLRAQASPDWQNCLLHFDGDAAEIERRAKAAGVPVMVTLVPSRAQAAMISMGEWPAGFDPYKLNNNLRAIVTSHGGTYIDLLPYFRSIPNPERGYFAVDGHLNARGTRSSPNCLPRNLPAVQFLN